MWVPWVARNSTVVKHLQRRVDPRHVLLLRLGQQRLGQQLQRRRAWTWRLPRLQALRLVLRQH